MELIRRACSEQEERWEEEVRALRRQQVERREEVEALQVGVVGCWLRLMFDSLCVLGVWLGQADVAALADAGVVDRRQTASDVAALGDVVDALRREMMVGRLVGVGDWGVRDCWGLGIQD